MANSDKSMEIKSRQDKLIAAFSKDGIVGERVLGPTMDNERTAGDLFVKKFYGHRILTDAFLDFFGGTIMQQRDMNAKIGWPRDEYYLMNLMMYLTMFRAVRASEVASVNGYTLQGYVIQRSVKDQAFVLCGAASGLATFGQLFGWEGLSDEEKSREYEAKVIQNRMAIERSIREKLIGKHSGLSAGAQTELERWNQMFNAEAHRGLYSLFRESSLVLKGERDISLVPYPDDLRDSMFVNRSTETNWMIHRLLPFMRRKETPHTDSWNSNWALLDGHFRWMVMALGSIGKKIAGAVAELIDQKFVFDPSTYFTEDTEAAKKHVEGKYRPFHSE